MNIFIVYLTFKYYIENSPQFSSTVMHHITTFRSMTDCIHDGGPIIFNIIILTIVLQLPTIFSTVTCCTGL